MPFAGFGDAVAVFGQGPQGAPTTSAGDAWLNWLNAAQNHINQNTPLPQYPPYPIPYDLVDQVRYLAQQLNLQLPPGQLPTGLSIPHFASSQGVPRTAPVTGPVSPLMGLPGAAPSATPPTQAPVPTPPAPLVTSPAPATSALPLSPVSTTTSSLLTSKNIAIAAVGAAVLIGVGYALSK
jgi:hypothetical protein